MMRFLLATLVFCLSFTSWAEDPTSVSYTHLTLPTISDV